MNLIKGFEIFSTYLCSMHKIYSKTNLLKRLYDFIESNFVQLAEAGHQPFVDIVLRPLVLKLCK